MSNGEVATFLVEVIKATINLSHDVVFTNAFLSIAIGVIGGAFIFALVKKAIGLINV